MKTKILITIGTLSGGGAERNLINFLNHFNREKFHVEILCYYKKGIYVDSVPRDVPIHYIANGKEYIKDNWLKPIKFKIAKKKMKFLRICPPLLYNSHLKSFNLEIAFLHDIIPYVALSPISRKIGFIRTDLLRGKQSKKGQLKIVESSKKFEKIIAVSQGAKNSFVELGANKQNVEVIYNPIDVEDIRHKAKEEFSFNNNSINIIAVGRLVIQKRYDRLIQAASLLENDIEVPSFKLHILGQGPLEYEMKKQIKSLGLSKIIVLHGYNNNPYKVIKQADILTLSSDCEGLPGVVCEALSLATPVVATNAAGVAELLENGELGIIVDKSIEALYVGLKKMILDQQLRDMYKSKMNNRIFPFDKKIVLPLLEETFL